MRLIEISNALLLEVYMKRVARDKAKEFFGYPVLFTDKLILTVTMPVGTILDDSIVASRHHSLTDPFDWFPGHKKFLNDVADILENEYGFLIVEDTKGNKRGEISINQERVSVYFNVIYDISKSSVIADKLKESDPLDSVSGYIGCGIELRLSDHNLTAGSSGNFDRYAKQQTDFIKKKNANKVDYTFDTQQQVELDDQLIQQFYNKGLQDIRDRLDRLILKWAKKIKELRDKGKFSGSISDSIN